MTTPATAWPLENAVFSAAMLAHRLPWADAPARALGLDSLTREGAARGVLAHLRRTRSGRPVRLRTPFGSFLVPLDRSDTAALLARGAESGALAPAVRLDAAGRRHGLHPHAVLPPGAAPSADQFAGPLSEELDRVLDLRRDDRALPWEVWRTSLLRAARRVVVGAAAAEDTLLSEVLRRAAGAAGSRTYDDRAAALGRRLAPYLADPDPDSVAGRLTRPAGGAAVPGARTEGAERPQVAPTEVLAHTLAVVSGAAVATALQALALTAARVPGASGDPAGAVALALDHYPPVAAAVHPVRSRFVWEDVAVEAGTEILAAPGWLRDVDVDGDRDRDVDGDGDGGEAGAPGFAPSPLCGSPVGCAAGSFAVRVAEEVVRYVAEAGRPVLLAPVFTPDRVPLALEPDTLQVAFATGTAGAAGAVPPPAGAASPAAYGALARADADRLDRHARSLAECAADTGWNGTETGERFRMRLLDHAERCARAAAEVRVAARRLGD
ncbi:hypothetical protein [Streptomyces sp. NRRL S-87]|uniref:hypothetical protein n=1 Tax=Streptomyces sp. NRRL S-87 TaxID=1463920 RepID=UPI0004C1A62E|nr:hypothetical protein [Streptomyces sp. NRRL S-87]